MAFRDLRLENLATGFRFAADLPDISVRHETASNVRRFIKDQTKPRRRLGNSGPAGPDRHYVAGHCKRVVRLQYDTRNALIQDVTGARPASGSAGRMLRIAASLAGVVRIDPADAVTGLDRTNLTLVLAALSHANGSHEHKEYVLERPAAGASPVITPATPVLELGPVLGWPA